MAITQPVTDELGKPVLDEDGTPQTEEVGFAGIRQEVDYLRQPIWAGPQAAIENVGAVAGIVWQLPVKVWETGVSLVTGEERDPNGPLSVVGAGVLAGEVAAADAPVLNRVAGLLSLLASLNIALFVFNMIPLLPLDGGHIAVALWEGIKRAWAKIFEPPAAEARRRDQARAGDVRRRHRARRDGRGADPRRHLQPDFALLRFFRRRMSIPALSVRCGNETVPLTKGSRP